MPRRDLPERYGKWETGYSRFRRWQRADHALGRSTGGFSTKVHLRAEGGGKPVCFVLTPGQRQEAAQLESLLERGAVARPGRGAVIPRLSNEPKRGVRFDRAADRQRTKIERLINRLKQHRAIATRYEKLATHYAALLTIACILRWL